jgi:hypothetical protein
VLGKRRHEDKQGWEEEEKAHRIGQSYLRVGPR